MQFKSYIVEIAAKKITEENIKFRVGAQTRDNAIKAALKKYPDFSKDDIVSVVCPSRKIPSGIVLTRFSAR